MSDRMKLFLGWVGVVIGFLLIFYGLFGFVRLFLEN